jgi:hypothetical protein
VLSVEFELGEVESLLVPDMETKIPTTIRTKTTGKAIAIFVYSEPGFDFSTE